MGDFNERWESQRPPKLNFKKPLREILVDSSRKLGEVEKKVERHGEHIRCKEKEAMKKLVSTIEEGRGEATPQASIIADYRKLETTADSLEVYIGGLKTRLDTFVALGDTTVALGIGTKSMKLLKPHMKELGKATRTFSDMFDDIFSGNYNWEFGPVLTDDMDILVDDDTRRVLAEAAATAKAKMASGEE